MRNKKSVKTKKCPFYDETCLESKCTIYSEMLKNCLIDVLAYNLYCLNETLKAKQLIKE